MAVVINDFEVVSDEGEQLQRATHAPESRPAATSNAASHAPTAYDIERILELLRERMERVRAH
jgi:hypothetical protein